MANRVVRSRVGKSKIECRRIRRLSFTRTTDHKTWPVCLGFEPSRKRWCPESPVRSNTEIDILERNGGCEAVDPRVGRADVRTERLELHQNISDLTITLLHERRTALGLRT